jgi:hypothetical protein
VKLRLYTVAAMIIAALLSTAAPTAQVEDKRWSPTITNNGWFPKLSPSGKQIVFGFWGTFYANLETGEQREIKDPEGGRLNPMGFLNETTIVAHTEVAGGKVYFISTSDFVPRHQAIPFEGAANWVHAQDGHYALSLANREFTVKDGQAFRQDIKQYGQVELAGDYMVIADKSDWVWTLFRGNDVARRLGQGAMATVNAHGDAAIGYFGPCTVYPAGQGAIDCTLSPARREGVPALVRVNGELWLWSAIEDHGASIIGRKLGETEPILLTNFPSVWTRVVWNGSHFVIAGNNTDGSLQVRWVRPGAKRTKLEQPPPSQCSNGADDDGDGLVDMKDPGCKSAEDNDEFPKHALEPPKLTKNFAAQFAEAWGDQRMDQTKTAAMAVGGREAMKRAYAYYLAAVVAALAGQGVSLEAAGQDVSTERVVVADQGKHWAVRVIVNDAPAWIPEGEVPASSARGAEAVQTPDLPGFVCQILKEERSKFSRINDPADLSTILNKTAYRANGNKVDGDWGLSTKKGGNRCPSPGSETNTDIACDILHRRSDNLIWDVLGSAGVGEKSEPNCGGALGPMGDGSRPWVRASVPADEQPKVEICGNGVDDNGNGQVDEGCPAPVEICGNGVDDDKDGLVDEGCNTGGGNDGDLDAVLEMLATLEGRLQALEIQHAAIMQAIADIPKAQVSDAKIDELIASINQERVVTFRLLGQNVTAVIKEGKK